MSTYILTSMFQNGFNAQAVEVFRNRISKRRKFAFVASEFEKMYEKTDKYFQYFLNMFKEVGIHFSEVCVVDGRMSISEVQKTVMEADVIWLSGGDTPTQFGYLKSYGLIPFIREHKGVVIGMSAGAINMAKTAVCTLTCEHDKQEIYEALGLVDFSVEPHLDKDNISEELLALSKEHSLYGICDEGAIICTDNNLLFLGDIFLLENGYVTKAS